MTQVRVFLALLLLAVAVHLPRLTLPDWRGTEARRVQIAAEMHERGDWLVPTLFGEPTFAKPPLYYWVLVATQRVLGDAPWALRLPSLVAFAVLGLVVHRALQKGHGAAAAWIGGLGVLAAPLVLQDLPVAEIDPLFAALTGCSIVLLARGAAFGETLSLAGGGLCGGLALLAKGPPFFLFLAGAALVWARRRRLRGAHWYLLGLALPPAAWLLALGAAGQGMRELARVAGEESVQRVFTYEWRHVLDTPAYFVRAVAVLLPLGLWTFHEYRGRDRLREARVPDDELLVRMPAAAAIGAILLLALFPGRPTRYLLPAVPLYVFAVAPAVANYVATGTSTPLQRRAVRALAVVAGAGLLVVSFLPRLLWLRTAVLLVALGVAPRLVARPAHVAGYVLALPLLAGATLYPDIAEVQAAVRPERPAAAILRAELRARDVRAVEARGHLPAAVLRDLGVPVIADEYLRRPPAGAWLLIEDPDREVRFDASRVAGYRERVRVRLPYKTLVLCERERG
jgi:4-amino-4-deoxy-L-arabinose transferase-like glycosyltransferase